MGQIDLILRQNNFAPEEIDRMEAIIYNHKEWIAETNPKALVSLMENLLGSALFTVLNKVEQDFSPNGFTAVWILAESHLAIHTFPESRRTYIELSSCNKQKNDHFIRLLAEHSVLA